MRPRVSVLLPTFNCSATVRYTLDCTRWADEILVVDSYSTDETVSICESYGARVIQHGYVNSARQKNWAAPQCSYEWILQIDSDEVLEPGLADEILKAIANAPPDVHAFRISRRNHFIGRWMRYAGLYPDYQIRLFRRGLGQWADREVHAHLRVPGAIGTLALSIFHTDAPSIAVRLRHLDRYTRYEADELRKKRVKFHWYDLVIRPSTAFLYRYVCLQGFREGWRGFIYCTYLAMYVFLSRAKLWEIEQQSLPQGPGS
jgi:glycosyltransferase involved in cell wall biosynthesis